MLGKVKCPYCGHENKVFIQDGAAWDQQIICCNLDSGGCDRYFVTVSTMKIESAAKKIEGEEDHVSNEGKYADMPTSEIGMRVCGLGSCSADNSLNRKLDCPFKGMGVCDNGGTTKYLNAHPEFRETLIRYLLEEEASNGDTGQVS